MRFWPQREVKQDMSIDALQRLIAAASGTIGSVTPENCMQAPTVRAIVTAISNRIKITPVHVYDTSLSNGKEIKEKLPNHPVANLLKRPNDWQSPVDYWQDLASSLTRHGKFISVKGQGQTGPIRSLFPIQAGDVAVQQDPVNLTVTFRHGETVYAMRKIHYIRGPARNYYDGDSPVEDVKTAIGLEIACEQFGASFFNNGAIPLLMFTYAQGMKFKDPEEEAKFIQDFQQAFSGKKRHRAFLVPAGIEPKDTVNIENDKAQFIETRKFNQTVIAGAWGVPPHLVGNLENGTYNNVEQQDKDFTLNVIMPYIKTIESAMERDLFTDEDRRQGRVIRFNMDATLRADFKTRMEGYATQIQHAMLTPNEARENEGENPSTDEAADQLYHSANLIPAGQLPTTEDLDDADPDPEDE